MGSRLWGKDGERAEGRDSLKLRRRDGKRDFERCVVLWDENLAVNSEAFPYRRERDRIAHGASTWFGRLFVLRYRWNRREGDVDVLWHERMDLGGAEGSIAFIFQKEIKASDGSSRAVGDCGTDRCFVDGDIPDVEGESRFLC